MRLESIRIPTAGTKHLPEENFMTTAVLTNVPARSKRDSEGAKKAARERMETAETVVTAVASYHSAADAIEEAQENLMNASQDRLVAIRKMRECRLTISEIGALTGLSSSRVQALAKGVDTAE